MKECMVRLIYCEMLGYESSFGYIHAIKLAQQGNLLEKRVGMYIPYLLCLNTFSQIVTNILMSRVKIMINTGTD